MFPIRTTQDKTPKPLDQRASANQTYSFRVWCEFDLRCNLDCVFCYNHCRDGASEAPKAASTSVILDSLTKLFRLPVTGIALSGGEITVRGDLETIVAHCTRAGIATTIISNGVFLTENRVAGLIQSGVAAFQISLHGSTAEIHDSITQRPSWKTVLANLISIRERGIPIVPVFVACPQNVRDFPNVVEIAALLDCSEIIFNQALTTTGAGRKNQHILLCDEDSVVTALSEANALAQQYDLTIRMGAPYLFERSRIDHLSNVSGGNPRDRGNLDQVTMDAFGNIRACSQSSINLGNVSAPEELLVALRSPPSKEEIAAGECTCLNLRYSTRSE